MSGGSFRYLAFADDLQEMLGLQDELICMRNRLHELGHVYAADRTNMILNAMKETEFVVQSIRTELYRVWVAVEWYDSGDYGIEEVNEAIANLKQIGDFVDE